MASIFKEGRQEVDIMTEHKESEKALQESEEKYRELVENINDVIYCVDKEGVITYISPVIRPFIGYEPAELIGRHFQEFFYEEDLPRLKENFKKISSGQAAANEYRILTKDGELRWMRTSSQPLYKGDRVVGVGGVISDITELKALEKKLRHAQKIELISTLARGIAHEFNNTLMRLSGSVELLQMRTPEDSKLRKYADIAKNSVQRMVQLTDQLQAYARGGKYENKTIDPADFVIATLALIKPTIKANLEIETDLNHDILNIDADPTQLQMAMSAVLQNASEAIEGEGRIRVLLRNEKIDEESAKKYPGFIPGTYVNLTIEDDGKGMDVETRRKIFEPFFTTKHKGGGLSMSAVFGIVKNHRGFIYVESEKGKGTAVRIYLPPSKSKKKEKDTQRAELLVKGKGSGTILLIDDDQVVRDVSREMLNKLGYRVLEAANGEEALNTAKTFEGKIDAALLNLVLPDIEGQALYPHLIKARPDLKVIICSGYPFDELAEKLLEAGAHSFLHKPFSVVTLSKKLDEALSANP